MYGIRIFHKGSDFYPILEREISRAKKEIFISVYTFRNDAIGKRFIEILKKKLDEGVTVRVVIDGLGSQPDSKEIIDAFGKHRDLVRVFRPQKDYLRRYPVSYLRRNHARIFLIDRKLLGVGGMGIGKIYNERQDLTAFIPITNANPVVSYFNDLWAFAEKTDTNCVASPELWKSSLITATIQALISTPRQEEQAIYQWVVQHINSAKKRIVIVSAWFLPTRELIQALCNAKDRGVDVSIVTPSHTDKPWYDDFRSVAISKLLIKNIVWHDTREYFHQKYLFIDNHWCLGSANFDMISMNRNYELNLCGHGGAVLQKLRANFHTLIEDSELAKRTKINWFASLIKRISYPLFNALMVTRK